MKKPVAIVSCMLALTLSALPFSAIALADPADGTLQDETAIEVTDTPEDDELAASTVTEEPATSDDETILDEPTDDEEETIDEPEVSADDATKDASTLQAAEDTAAIEAANEKPESWNDPHPPTFVSASINGTVFSVGDTIKINCNITDEDGIAYITALSVPPSSDRPSVAGMEDRVTSSHTPGTHKIVGFQITDRAGYITTFINPAYSDHAGDWEFYGKVIITDVPIIPYLLGDKTKENIYKVLEGNNAVVEKGNATDLSVRFDGDLDKFVVATMDGEAISPDCYTLASGSTIITLSRDYLNSLTPGTHTLAAWYEDGGNGLATITITGSSDPAGTIAGASGPNGDDQAITADTVRNDRLVGSDLAQTGDNALTSAASSAIIALLFGFVVLIAGRKAKGDRSN